MNQHDEEDAPTNGYEKLARDLEAAARLWRDFGKTAEEVTAGWESGPRSPALEPSGGARYEDCFDPSCVECPNPAGEEAERQHKHAVPSDPTGEAVLRPEEFAGRYRKLVAEVAALNDAAYWVRRIVKEAVPAARTSTPARVDESREELSRAGWCVSCYRVDKRCEPVATQVSKRTGNTETVYSDYCWWCGRFIAEWRDILGAQGLPPIELVRLHHTHGKRVTEAKVIEAMSKVADRAKDKRKRTHDEIQADITDRRGHRLAG